MSLQFQGRQVSSSQPELGKDIEGSSTGRLLGTAWNQLSLLSKAPMVAIGSNPGTAGLRVSSWGRCFRKASLDMTLKLEVEEGGEVRKGMGGNDCCAA